MKHFIDIQLQEEPAQPSRKTPIRRSTRTNGKAETAEPSLEETLKAVLDKEVASRSTLKAKRTPKKKFLAIEPAYINNPSNPTVVIENIDNSVLLRKNNEAAVQEVVDLEGPQQAAEAAAKEKEEEDRLLMDIELFGSPSP